MWAVGVGICLQVPVAEVIYMQTRLVVTTRVLASWHAVEGLSTRGAPARMKRIFGVFVSPTWRARASSSAVHHVMARTTLATTCSRGLGGGVAKQSPAVSIHG